MIIYLYVKEHSKTGLKYFGVTKKKDPFKYKGSGKYWLKHINKHGNNNIKTLEIWGFDNQKLCTEFALKFSKDNNIVISKEWANLREENGLDGNPLGVSFSETTRAKWSETRRGSNNSFYGKQHTQETREHFSKIRKGRPGKPHTEASKAKIGEASRKHMTGRKLSTETRLKMSASRKGKLQGGSNPMAKKIYIDGKIYNSISEACISLNITRYECSKRILSHHT